MQRNPTNKQQIPYDTTRHWEGDDVVFGIPTFGGSLLSEGRMQTKP